MSTVYGFHYELPTSREWTRIHPSQGMLLAVDINGVRGYSDLHPWPSLGDLNVKEQLERFAIGKPTRQFLCSLDAAQRDAHARASQKRGVRFLSSIRNHILLLNNFYSIETLNSLLEPMKLRTPEVQTLKWKITPARAHEASQCINSAAAQFSNILWRLDANALFDFEAIHNFWKTLSPRAQSQIEFIEDPCPYDPDQWHALENSGIPLAIDLELTRWLQIKNTPFPSLSHQTIFIFKPAIQSMVHWQYWLRQNPHRFVITSYLDHPVGLLHALWWAETLQEEWGAQLLTCGLNLSLRESELNAMWPHLTINANHGRIWEGPTSDFGIGFSAHLEALPWQHLGSL